MLIAIDEAVIDLAMGLARRHGLRGYDAVQLACALEVAQSAGEAGDTLTLWSSDTELLEGARTEGLAARNPAATTQ